MSIERDTVVIEAITRLETTQEEVSTTIKDMLQHAVQEIRDRKLTIGLPASLQITRRQEMPEGLLLDLGVTDGGVSGPLAGYNHIVLRDDGKLYNLRVLGEDDGDGEWEYLGELSGELDAKGYIEYGLRATKGVGQLLVRASGRRGR